MAYKRGIDREEKRSTRSVTGGFNRRGDKRERLQSLNYSPISIQLILTFPLNLNRINFTKVKIVLELIQPSYSKRFGEAISKLITNWYKTNIK